MNPRNIAVLQAQGSLKKGTGLCHLCLYKCVCACVCLFICSFVHACHQVDLCLLLELIFLEGSLWPVAVDNNIMEPCL